MQEFALLSIPSSPSVLNGLVIKAFFHNIVSQSFVPQFKRQEVGGDITDKDKRCTESCIQQTGTWALQINCYVQSSQQHMKLRKYYVTKVGKHMRHKHGGKVQCSHADKHSEAVTTGKLLPVSVHDPTKQRGTRTKELAHLQSKAITF